MNGLTRRTILRGIAAGAGGLALLPIMTRLTSASPMPTMRFLFIVEGNCYEPVTVLDPSTLAAINARTTRPIDGLRWWFDNYQHQAPITVSSTQFANTIALPSIALQKLEAQTAVVYGLSSRITGGGHSAFHGALSSTRTVGGSPGGITIDAYLAGLTSVRQSTPFDAVRVGMVANNVPERLSYATCAFGAGQAAPAMVDPLSAYNTLFGLVASPAQAAASASGGRCSITRKRT